MKTKIEPLEDRIVIKLDKEGGVTKAGILLPFGSKENSQKGTVVCVGPGTKDIPMTLKQGDCVLLAKPCGLPFLDDGEEYIVLRVGQVFMKLS